MIFLLLCSVLLPPAFIFIKHKFGGLPATVAKAAASLSFLLLGLIIFLEEGCPSFEAFILVGLFFGLLGDVFLDLQEPNKGKNTAFLHAGICAFAFQHISVALGVIRHPSVEFKFLPLALSVFVGFAIGFGITIFDKFYLNFAFGRSFILSALYASILSSAFVYYLLLTVYSADMTVLFLALGLFLLSDLLLSIMYFSGKNKVLSLLIFNILTYYAAQILLACFPVLSK